MNSAFHNEIRDRDYADYRDTEPQDREISLGTATVLGIFLALALLCALFFGLGYSLGRRTPQPAVVSAPETPSDAPTPSTAGKTVPGTVAAPLPVEIQPPAEAPGPAGRTAQKPAAATAQLPQSTSEKPASITTFVVQIAAVSHREDANTLITALEQRGYEVVVRQEPQDKLLHVQLGPFVTRKEADAMRLHLLSDGYNAIVK